MTIAERLAEVLNGPNPPDWFATIDGSDPVAWRPDSDRWGTGSGDSVTFADGSELTLWPGHFGGDWVAGLSEERTVKDFVAAEFGDFAASKIRVIRI